ncbi:hypothetical protein EYF80_009469 [Liparis tanakae]|uniref:Uncharacterized protein n=1 Tax=Liparis tanakae TaxID=230148 RepID=A0A4Z2IR87_9TELE|nr:hypothetical protein EYF80_009469 [Liparis tanakae]
MQFISWTVGMVPYWLTAKCCWRKKRLENGRNTLIRPESRGGEREVTVVWVFLNTTVEPVIIVGEEETDELITLRERRDLAREER